LEGPWKALGKRRECPWKDFGRRAAPVARGGGDSGLSGRLRLAIRQAFPVAARGVRPSQPG
jgi:hypothetical protein